MEVLQTSPLTTWVRRRATDQILTRRWGVNATSANASRRRGRCERSARGARGRRSGGRLVCRLLPLLFLLLPLLECLHSALRLAPLAHVAFECTATSHGITSRRGLTATPPRALSDRA